MEPVPETVVALEALGDDNLLARQLHQIADLVQQSVPECIGLSVALVPEQLTFTLVASDSSIARLDALQYLAGGPCVEAVAANELLQFDTQELLDEGRWRWFAERAEDAGVRSTLSLPIEDDGHGVVAGLNLYGSTPDAFDGKVDHLSRALGVTRDMAVTNADLSFSSRLRAAVAPLELADQAVLDRAVGVLAEREHLGTEEAAQRMRQAAAQAGVKVMHLARLLLRSDDS